MVCYRDGLNRYDGYHFKTYTTLRQGAYNNSVEWVAEDAAGNIWIKTPVNYCFYDREMDELDNRTELLLHKIGIFESPRQLFIDDDKNLWCVADNTLYYYIFSDETLYKQSLPGSVNIADMACRNKRCYILMTDGNVINIDWCTNPYQTVSYGNTYHLCASHLSGLFFPALGVRPAQRGCQMLFSDRKQLD